MSSLLQHHGCTTTPKPGYVELLMYLETHTKTPLACSHCGQHWQHGDIHCRQCKRFVLFAWDHVTRESYGSSTKRATEILTMEDAIKHPAYQQCKSQDDTCTVSNRWERSDTEPVIFTRPDGTDTTVAKLYRIWRKPVDMMGCWVGFRYNGEVHYPDLSVPIGVDKLPRDAKPLTCGEASGYWFTP